MKTLCKQLVSIALCAVFAASAGACATDGDKNPSTVAPESVDVSNVRFEQSDFIDWAIIDPEELYAFSDTVFTGKVTDISFEYFPGGYSEEMSLYTIYEFAVTDVEKGDTGETARVIQYGGRMDHIEEQVALMSKYGRYHGSIPFQSESYPMDIGGTYRVMARRETCGDRDYFAANPPQSAISVISAT